MPIWHCRGNEAGGFFVGLEGVPVVAGTLDNRQVLALHRPEERYLSFYYAAAGELQEKFSHRLLKYHPRREKYSPAEVRRPSGGTVRLRSCLTR